MIEKRLRKLSPETILTNRPIEETRELALNPWQDHQIARFFFLLF
jgi:hypothetical protein